MTIKHLGGIFGRNPTFNEVTVDGNLNANDNIVMANGKGIDFSATSGAGTSELLDDYEEGTWTPVYVPASGAFATLTMDSPASAYVKVGKQVYASAIVRTDNVDLGTASGFLRVSGLPFTVSDWPSVVIGRATAFSANEFPSGGYGNQGTNYVLLQERNASDGSSQFCAVSCLVTGEVANQNYMFFSMIYETEQ